jgi:hypothetical protein
MNCGKCHCNSDIKIYKNKEYTILELLDFPVGTKFKDNEGYTVKVKEMACIGHKKICFDSDSDDLIVSTGWRDAKFTIIEETKPVDFITAWKALEDEKTIESTYTLDRYKKIDGLIKIQHQGGEFEKCGNIATTEIGNTWIIID